MKIYQLLIKPIFDFIISIILLTITLPFLVFIYLILLYFNSGKAFFIQPRVGKNEMIFNLIKFKTMNDKTDDNNELLPDIERMTKFGNLLRKFSLDELPQLVNILKGDLSLIGPRPLLIEYLPLYNDFQRQRLFVKPGITGWAQVNGRNTISWQKKFEYDIYYVNNLSFKLDIKIFFMTIIKIIKLDGINSNNQVTMEKFGGNN